MGCLKLPYQEKDDRPNFLAVWRKNAGKESCDNYYPFGLTFNSANRENSIENQWKFQGQEHVDDLGLSWDSFKWRNHQPEIGRFFNLDPLADKYLYNSPYAFSENQVVSHRELEGLEKINVIGAEFVAYQQKVSVYAGSPDKFTEGPNNKNFGSAPDGREYKQMDAQVESSTGEILSKNLIEGDEGPLEEFFDFVTTGNHDNFDHSIDGTDTKGGSTLQGNIEGADFNIDVSMSKDVMTFTTKMSGGNNDKAYSIKVRDKGGIGGTVVIGSLVSGRAQNSSTTTVSIPFTVDKNGNAVFDNDKMNELYFKDHAKSTRKE